MSLFSLLLSLLSVVVGSAVAAAVAVVVVAVATAAAETEVVVWIFLRHQKPVWETPLGRMVTRDLNNALAHCPPL